MNNLSNIPQEAIDKLMAARKELELYNEFDWELTVGGNGYNAFEAVGGLKMAFEALGITWPKNVRLTKAEKRQFIIDNDESPEDYDL